ncbi:hypothetical protein CCUG60884_04231 [Mycobacteroides salmoniphilum]|uniref:Uncharacterized protein n=1 Tax=Mycobacteroides salmoniphilum TaxID=404941 RepID=A0A4R8SN06_9MYCO|nr:hypothetical protein CCUG60884_04231 [Mycobacteroides salmoniphilum]
MAIKYPPEPWWLKQRRYVAATRVTCLMGAFLKFSVKPILVYLYVWAVLSRN